MGRLRARRSSVTQDGRQPHGRMGVAETPTDGSQLRVQGEITGLPKYGIVGDSQSALMMINPMISPRTRAPRRRTVEQLQLLGAPDPLCAPHLAHPILES
eukprot:COSAG01_NODE_1401_length_10450_cov_100.148198_14_plen_100_part_00